MITIWAIIGGWILVCEITLWMLFRHKCRGIMFPKEMDESFFGFFTLHRMGFVALMHTIFLLSVLFFSTILLW